GAGTWRAISSAWKRHWPPSLRPSISPASSRRYKVRREILRMSHASSAVRNSVVMAPSHAAARRRWAWGVLHLLGEIPHRRDGYAPQSPFLRGADISLSIAVGMTRPPPPFARRYALEVSVVAFCLTLAVFVQRLPSGWKWLSLASPLLRFRRRHVYAPARHQR